MDLLSQRPGPFLDWGREGQHPLKSNPAPGEPEQGNARYEYERAGNPVLVQEGWRKCNKPEIYVFLISWVMLPSV